MICRPVVALLVLVGTAHAQPAPKPEPPVSADPRLVIELFAASPDIVQPIATDFDAKGRLLVVESHTHFRPAKYTGPKFDRIRVIEDTDGDGKADRFTTFFEGTTATMDLAVHPDGSVYVATRNEILRLRDADGDGKADEKVRIAFLDTAGNYPHNGLSGLSFDSRGNLTFGMGENLGATYTLTGAYGTTLTGGGEGGNVYHCTAEGKKLRRVATGFWNPFGSCRDIFGRLFVVDNDPDSSPPCRLVHVVEGGDYGFQFRYGRAGRHPFQAWNGELPGTLPYVAGTGESPCEVIAYESDGLPDDYRGNLLVPAWADHRLERYVVRPNGASVAADRKPFIQGGRNFYPSGLAVAPDGSLFVSDWGSRSYELHGKGAIWHIRWKDAKPAKRPTDPKTAILSPDRKTREVAARVLAKSDEGRSLLRKQLSSKDVRLRAAALRALIDSGESETNHVWVGREDPEIAIRAMAVRTPHSRRRSDTKEFTAKGQPAPVRAAAMAGMYHTQDVPVMLDLMLADDPFLRHAAIHRLGALPDLLQRIDITQLHEVKQRIGLLLAWRASGHKDATKALAGFLADTDPTVRFLAIKWVSDEKLAAFRPRLVGMMNRPDLSPREYIGLATALARLDDKPVNENGLAAYFLDRLKDTAAPLPAQLMALKAIPANHAKLPLTLLLELLRQDDPAFRTEVLRTLKDRTDGARAAAAVLAIARDTKQPVAVRAQSLVTLAAIGASDVDVLTELASGNDAVLRREALRAITQVKLTTDQQARLGAAVKGKPDVANLTARVLGKPFFANRPPTTTIDAWLKWLEGPADVDTGRRVFENTRISACSLCHRVDGRGADIGPDLSLIGRTERRWIVESILQPSAVVAPHYQTWKVELVDGRVITGLLVGTYLDESVYVDEKGLKVKVLASDVLNATPVRNSIMPDGLADRLTDQELRDLVAYLASRR